MKSISQLRFTERERLHESISPNLPVRMISQMDLNIEYTPFRKISNFTLENYSSEIVCKVKTKGAILLISLFPKFRI